MGLAEAIPNPAGAAVKPAQMADKGALSALLALGRPLIMGILNVTPDSFSDGGRFIDPKAAIAHAEAMVEQGADILDIGAESTRPYGGAKPITADEELSRLAPVLPAVAKPGVPVSIDTIKANVAAWALDHGATIVNDVWGLQRDPDMAPLIAERGVPVIVMHNRDSADESIDIVADVVAFFTRSLAIAESAGIAREKIILDPGIGFGKTPEQSIICIAKLSKFRRFGLPLLVGASRKRFINSVTPSAPDDRIGGSIASHLIAVENGAAIIRAHDVKETVQALRIAAAIGHAKANDK
jgi:dihydropteroate synthase